MAEAIVAAAARVIATRGDHASMSDVAAEAGIARATLYRYFSSRAALLEEVASHAAAEAGERFAAARIDEVGAHEGVRRAVRALLDVGDPFVALAREHVRPDEASFERFIAAPLRRLVEHGQETGELRTDVPTEWLSEALVALVLLVLAERRALGREDAVAAIASLYLDGARSRGSP